MKLIANPPTPWPNWQAPASTRKLADHHGARGRAWTGSSLPRVRFLCRTTKPTRSQMMAKVENERSPDEASRRHPLFFFSDLPPALQHIRHTTRDPGGSRTAVLRNKTAGSRPAWLGYMVFWVLHSSRQVGAGSRGRTATTDGIPTPHQNSVVSQNSGAPVQRRATQPRPCPVCPSRHHKAGYSQLSPGSQRTPLSRLPFKRTATTISSHHDMHITSPNHCILHCTHRPTRRA